MKNNKETKKINKNNTKKPSEKNKDLKKATTKIKKEKDSNIITLNRKFDGKNLIYTTKLRNVFIVIILVFINLLGRIGYLQFVEGAYLTEVAYQQ